MRLISHAKLTMKYFVQGPFSLSVKTLYIETNNPIIKGSEVTTDKIRTISQSLKLAHKDFIAAKVTISDEDLGLV